MRTLHSGTASVDYLGVLHASGEDARQFLHSQLSQDFMLLGHDKARLAAFLSAKGRMQASFIGLRHGAHDVLLLVDKSLLASVQKRLSMFILRAKVKLTDATQDWQIQGLIGAQTIANIAAQAAQAPAAALTPWSVLTLPSTESAPASGYLIGLYPAQGELRALHLAPAQQRLPAPNLPTEAWRLAEIESGVATLSAAVTEQFVPQMLNYESIGGVNFKKGCYPGQEVVARSQFRGAIKRRAYLAHSPQPEGAGPSFAAGDEIYACSEPVQDGQPCGVVVQTALREDGTRLAIVSIQTASAQTPLEVRPHTEGSAAPVHVAIAVQAVPYPILEDI